MNNKFPGLPDYVGPSKGYFAFVHHESLVEYSADIHERIDYIKKAKPTHEQEVRLSHLLYLGKAGSDYAKKLKPLTDDYAKKLKRLDDDYWAERKPLDDDYAKEFKRLDDDYVEERKPLDAEILTYVRTLIPDCKWDEKSRELIFPEDIG